MTKRLRSMFLVPMVLMLVLLSGCSSNGNQSLADESQHPLPDETTAGTESSVESKFFSSEYGSYITLLEAVDLADSYFEYFQKDASKATLVDVLSQDETANYEGQGTDGTRYKWGLSFQKTSNPEESYVVEIAGGQVMSCLDGGYPVGDVIDVSKDIIDSKQAQEIAEEYGLQPGTVWPVGYDYGLEIGTIYGSDEEYTMLTVYGQNEDCTFATVTLDAYTGDILCASQKVVDEDGNGEWVDW